MAIRTQVLGQPGRDNSVYVEVDSGQSIKRLLFDCGDGCLNALSVSDLQSIDAVFFSHFHMDHVSGFDALFRHNYNREDEPFLIVGPEDTLRVMTHRLRGYTWNLIQKAEGSVCVREFTKDYLREVNLLTCKGFEETDEETKADFKGDVLTTPELNVSAILLDHGCVSAGYLVREAAKRNVDPARLQSGGFSPGPWLAQVKDESLGDEQSVEVGDATHTLGDLRQALLSNCPGSSFAYLTDFRVSEETREELVAFLHKVDVVICENNYRDADEGLAMKHYHLTSTEVGRLAKEAEIGQLVLFHLSDRYTKEEWAEQLVEVKEQFENTCWPHSWSI